MKDLDIIGIFLTCRGYCSIALTRQVLTLQSDNRYMISLPYPATIRP